MPKLSLVMSIKSQSQLRLAVQAFQAGKLVEAERNATAALEDEPRSADALHLLGVIRGVQDRHEEAERFLKKATEFEKRNNFIFFNLAKSLSAQDKDEESIRWHKKALELDPRHAMSWLNYGKSLFKLNDIGGAIAAYDKAISANGNLAEAYTNKGICLRARQAFDQALPLHQVAIKLSPNSPEVWRNHGVALSDLNRHEEALNSYARAIELAPNHAEAWNNQGVALNDLRRHEEALTSYARAIEIKPNYASAWNNRGIVLAALKRHMDALECYERAIEINPAFVDAWSNLGLALSDIQRHDQALESYARAIELNPDHPEAHHNKGLLELRRHDYLSGFKNCLWRWKTKEFLSERFDSHIPRCEPGSVRGRILLRAEQGLGDEIFYCGLLPLVSNPEAKLTLSADLRLHPILKRSFPSVELIDRKDTASELIGGDYDTQADIGDLGYLLGLDKEAIQSTRKPYLIPNAEKSLQLKSSEPILRKGPICGLSWRSKNQKFGQDKSIQLPDFAPLLKTPGLSFVNLQYGDVGDEIAHTQSLNGIKIHQINQIDPFSDIDGLLSLIDACDVILTTSNVTAHLAGSIGKKGCVLIPYGQGRLWYWHHDDDFSFWYPTLKVFYQEDPHDWSSTINKAADWIKQSF